MSILRSDQPSHQLTDIFGMYIHVSYAYLTIFRVFAAELTLLNPLMSYSLNELARVQLAVDRAPRPVGSRQLALERVA